MKIRKTKKIKKIRKTKKIKKIRKTKKRGGKLLGKGSYGSVYGDPRLPCDDEEEVPYDNKASKIFESDTDADEEFDVLIKLNEKLTPVQLSKLKEHCILPERKCILNKTLVRSSPLYSEDSYILPKISDEDAKEIAKYGSDIKAYAEDVANKEAGKYIEEPGISNLSQHEKSDHFLRVYEESFDNALELAKNELPRQLIISEMGISSLDNYFVSHEKTIANFFDFVKKLLNIVEGIELLQEYGFIHNDIKLENCVAVKSEGSSPAISNKEISLQQFKIIDMADTRFIDTTVDSIAMPRCYSYSPWPSICVYTGFFDETHTKLFDDKPADSPSSSSLLGRLNKGYRKMFPAKPVILMNTELLLALFSRDPIYNRSAYMNVDYLFKRSFNVEYLSLFFDEKDLAIIAELQNNMMLQKTFGLGFDFWTGYNGRHIDKEEKSTLDTFLSGFNETLRKIKTLKETKRDLFKRVDIYSFGIMVLTSIKTFFGLFTIDQLSECTPNQKKSIKETLMKLYLIVEKCCIQRDRVIDIKEVVSDYKTLVDFINSIDTSSLVYLQGHPYTSVFSSEDTSEVDSSVGSSAYSTPDSSPESPSPESPSTESPSTESPSTESPQESPQESPPPESKNSE